MDEHLTHFSEVSPHRCSGERGKAPQKKIPSLGFIPAAAQPALVGV